MSSESKAMMTIGMEIAGNQSSPWLRGRFNNSLSLAARLFIVDSPQLRWEGGNEEHFGPFGLESETCARSGLANKEYMCWHFSVSVAPGAR